MKFRFKTLTNLPILCYFVIELEGGINLMNNLIVVLLEGLNIILEQQNTSINTSTKDGINQHTI